MRELIDNTPAIPVIALFVSLVLWWLFTEWLFRPKKAADKFKEQYAASSSHTAVSHNSSVTNASNSLRREANAGVSDQPHQSSAQASRQDDFTLTADSTERAKAARRNSNQKRPSKLRTRSHMGAVGQKRVNRPAYRQAKSQTVVGTTESPVRSFTPKQEPKTSDNQGIKTKASIGNSAAGNAATSPAIDKQGPITKADEIRSKSDAKRTDSTQFTDTNSAVPGTDSANLPDPVERQHEHRTDNKDLPNTALSDPLKDRSAARNIGKEQRTEYHHAGRLQQIESKPVSGAIALTSRSPAPNQESATSDHQNLKNTDSVRRDAATPADTDNKHRTDARADEAASASGEKLDHSVRSTESGATVSVSDRSTLPNQTAERRNEQPRADNRPNAPGSDQLASDQSFANKNSTEQPAENQRTTRLQISGTTAPPIKPFAGKPESAHKSLKNTDSTGQHTGSNDTGPTDNDNHQSNARADEAKLPSGEHSANSTQATAATINKPDNKSDQLNPSDQSSDLQNEPLPADHTTPSPLASEANQLTANKSPSGNSGSETHRSDQHRGQPGVEQQDDQTSDGESADRVPTEQNSNAPSNSSPSFARFLESAGRGSDQDAAHNQATTVAQDPKLISAPTDGTESSNNTTANSAPVALQFNQHEQEGNSEQKRIFGGTTAKEGPKATGDKEGAGDRETTGNIEAARRGPYASHQIESNKPSINSPRTANLSQHPDVTGHTLSTLSPEKEGVNRLAENSTGLAGTDKRTHSEVEAHINAQRNAGINTVHDGAKKESPPKYQTAAKAKFTPSSVEAQTQIKIPVSQAPVDDDKDQLIKLLQAQISALKDANKANHSPDATGTNTLKLATAQSTVANGVAAAAQSVDQTQATTLLAKSTPLQATAADHNAANSTIDTDQFEKKYLAANEQLSLSERKLERLQSTLSRMQAAGVPEIVNQPRPLGSRATLLSKVRVLDKNSARSGTQ